MGIERMTARQLRIGAKTGMTASDFGAKYQCTEEEFFRHLRHIYRNDGGTLRTVMGLLDSNAKRPGLSKTRKALSTVADRSEPTSKNEQHTAVEANSEAAVAKATGQEPKATNMDATEHQLSVLRDQENALREQNGEVEAQYGVLVKEHADMVEKLRTCATLVDALRDQFRARYNEFQELTTRCAELRKNLDGLAERHAHIDAEIVEIRKEIASLNAVDVYVLDDGSVIVDGGRKLDLDSVDYEALFRELLAQPCCEQLRISEIRLLARLVKSTEQSEFRYNFAFDSSELGKVYQEITESRTAQLAPTESIGSPVSEAIATI